MERIEKFLAHNGLCSRQDAKRLIRQKKILVNGIPVLKAGVQIDPAKDKVEMAGIEIAPATKESFILLHKPKGYVTSKKEPAGQPTVYELLPEGIPSDTNAVGRLDLDSTGLLLFVNDGTLIHRLTHPKHHVEKEYTVMLNGKLTAGIKNQIETGIVLDQKKTKPCKIFDINFEKGMTFLHIIITEGKNRQIRRTFGKFDLPVLELKRIRFGEISLADLPAGKTRELSAEEIYYLKNITH